MIHIDFASFDEMVVFAEQLLGHGRERVEEKETPAASPNPAPVPPTQAVQTPPAAMPVSSMHAPASEQRVPVSAPAPQAPAKSSAGTVPTSAKEYSLDELAAAAIPLMDAGGQQALTELLHRFGVATLPELPKEQYGAFATALRTMGAKI